MHKKELLLTHYFEWVLFYRLGNIHHYLLIRLA